MSRSALVRAGGIMAVVAGVLRASASFAPGVATDTLRQLLYFAVDICLLFGLLGFYELRHQDVGRTGAFGFVLALFGLLAIRSSGAIPGLDLYQAGAIAVAGGLILLSGRAWLARALPLWVPGAFVVSTVAGLVGAAAATLQWLLVVSGVVFGGAFAGLGVDTWLAGRALGSSSANGSSMSDRR